MKRGNKVRIIAGRWRGRLVTFAEHKGLRPTGDRLRETLFSWLQPVLPGSRCLDMFAGSGVLGFESISRGATAAVLIESSPRVVEMIDATAAALGTLDVKIICGNSLNKLTLTTHCEAGSVDIAFIDPPFGDRIQQQAVDNLFVSGVLAPDALIAIESDKRASVISAPPGWRLRREKVAGEVRLQLFLVSG